MSTTNVAAIAVGVPESWLSEEAKIELADKLEAMLFMNNAKENFFGVIFKEVHNSYLDLQVDNGRFLYDLCSLQSQFNKIAKIESSAVLIQFNY